MKSCRKSSRKCLQAHIELTLQRWTGSVEIKLPQSMNLNPLFPKTNMIWEGIMSKINMWRWIILCSKNQHVACHCWLASMYFRSKALYYSISVDKVHVLGFFPVRAMQLRVVADHASPHKERPAWTWLPDDTHLKGGTVKGVKLPMLAANTPL